MSRVRKEPYDPSLFESEAWRQFWWGKTSRTRKATTEYLKKYWTPSEITQWDVSKKHNCTDVAVMLNIKNLKAEGIIENLKHTSQTRRRPE